jgi:hypothetical protein
VNSTPLGAPQTRNQPNVLFYKPAGVNNDFVIGSTHHGGEEYTVVFNSGTPLSADWNGATQTLSVVIDANQTALELVNTINAATGEVDVEASLGYDGDGSAPPLDPTHFEPIGGDPPNNRGFGAGSCSYCHDHDGQLDDNGDSAPALIVNNHDTHHGIGLPFFVSDGAGGTWRRCNLCHNYTDRAAPDPPTYHDQSGPAFDLHIRICEECHGPESLHNIQVDSDGNGLVVGGELAGYGHVGRDSGPGDSDCWGCHGFGTASVPDAGPIIPTVYDANGSVMGAGAATAVTLTGASFKNVTEGVEYVSKASLTAVDGSSVTLTPDAVDNGAMVVTIPAETAPGNYELRAVKADVTSNPVVISVTPKVKITETAADKSVVTITGSGFGGYAAGSGTSVVGKLTRRRGGNTTSETLEAEIVSWSDTKIEADFGSKRPNQVTVNSVFGSATEIVQQRTGRKRSK